MIITPLIGESTLLITPADLGNTNPMAGVTKDATSGIYCPATAAEWATVLAVAGIGSGGPSALWLMQEASGNPADSIGAFGLNASGAPAYQSTVTGWSRKAIVLSDGASQTMFNSSASLPDIGTGSLLTLAYVTTTGAPAAIRNGITHGATQAAIALTTALKPEAKANANTALGSVSLGTSPVPIVLKSDSPHSIVAGYTLADKMIPTFSAVSGQEITFGPHAASSNAPPWGFLYGAAFFNAAAQLSDAQVKKLLQTLGWSPTWT